MENQGQGFTWTAEHRLDCAGRQCVLLLDDELMSVRRDQLHVHRVRSLAATELHLLLALGHHGCFGLTRHSTGYGVLDGEISRRQLQTLGSAFQESQPSRNNS